MGNDQDDRPPRVELLIDVKEAAQQLSVSFNTVRSLIEDGELRTVRVGRRLCLPADEPANYVQRLIEERDRRRRKSSGRRAR